MKNELADAEMLARFANLKPEEVEEFRHSVAPNFVPDIWWTEDARRIDDSQIEGVKIWRAMQDLIHEAWTSGFEVNLTLSVLLNYTILAVEAASLIPGAPTSTFLAMPYQTAVMFLFNQSWRARTCNHCHKPFVAHEPADQFCSKACKIEFRRRYKAAHIRERRKREKQRKQSKRR